MHVELAIEDTEIKIPKKRKKERKKTHIQNKYLLGQHL